MTNKEFKQSKLLLEALKLGSRGVSKSQIAKQTGIPRSTLQGWLNKAQTIELTYLIAKEMSLMELDELMFSHSRITEKYYQPQWDAVHIEMGKPKMQLQKCFDAYLLSVPEGEKAMSRSAFYREYEIQSTKLNPQVQAIHVANSYEPAEIAMIDYSGNILEIAGGPSGEQGFQVFVGVLPYSGKTFIYATEHQRREDWFEAIAAMFNYFGGVTEQLVLDNARPLVEKADKFAPKLSPFLVNFCKIYDTEPVATAPHQPKAKATVERAVGIVQARIYDEIESLPLTNRTELNKALKRASDQLNERPLSDGTRQSRNYRFKEESPLLKPLPAYGYDPDCDIVDLKISKENQVRIKNVRYGVRWGHAGETARVFINKKKNLVTFFLRDSMEEIGSHALEKPGTKIATKAEDLPPSMQRYRETVKQLLERILKEVGPKTHELATHITKHAGTQSARHLNGILTLAYKYTSSVMEEVSAEVLAGYKKTYNEVVKVAGTYFKKSKNKPASSEKAYKGRSSLRGAEYYKQRYEQLTSNNKNSDNGKQKSTENTDEQIK